MHKQALIVLTIVIIPENGPVDLDNVQITENTVEVEVVDAIDIVLADHRRWHRLWKEWEQIGTIVQDMDMIITEVEEGVQLPGDQTIIHLLTMAIITMETTVTVTGLCFLCYF